MSVNPVPAIKQPVWSAVLIGLAAGLTAALLTLVRWPTQEHPAPSVWQTGTLLLGLVLVASVCLWHRANNASRMSQAASVAAKVSGALAALCAYLAANGMLSASTSYLELGMSLATAAVTTLIPHSAKTVVGCTGLVLLSGIYGWSGFRPNPQLAVSAAVLAFIVALGFAGVVAANKSRNHKLLRVVLVCCASISAVFAFSPLVAYPLSWASREWDSQPVQTIATQISTGFPVDNAILWSPVSAAVSANGEVAVLDRVGSQKYVLWRMNAAGSWSFTNVSTPFRRPDGADIFLSGYSESGQTQNVRSELSPSRDREAIANIADEGTIAFSGSDIFGVSNSGLWKLEGSGVRIIATPWDRRAVQRSIAINSVGHAAVVSQYAPLGEEGSYSVAVELIDLGSGALTPIDFDTAMPSTPSAAAIPSSSAVRTDQWATLGVSVLPDDSFVTLVGELPVGFDSNGIRRSLMPQELAAEPERIDSFAVSGDMLAFRTGRATYMPRFSYVDGLLELQNNNQGQNGENQNIDPSGSPSEISRCGQLGTSLPVMLTTEKIVVANSAAGAPSVLVSSGYACTAGVWRNDTGNAAWSLLNSTMDLYSNPLPASVSLTGLVHAPFDFDGSTAIISSALSAEMRITAGNAEFAVRNPGSMSEYGSTWMRRVVATVHESGTTWLLANSVSDQWEDAVGDASLFRSLPDGAWQRVMVVEGASAMALSMDRSLIVGRCAGLTELGIEPMVRLLDSNNVAAVSTLVRSIASTSSSWKADDSGCTVESQPAGSDVAHKLGFVHSITIDQQSPDYLLIAQSVLASDQQWHHLISRVDRKSGEVRPASSTVFDNGQLIPIQIAARGDGALCVATLDADGAGPLLYLKGVVARKLALNDDIRANGCAWAKDSLIATDSATGNTYSVRSTDRRGF